MEIKMVCIAPWCIFRSFRGESRFSCHHFLIVGFTIIELTLLEVKLGAVLEVELLGAELDS
jgi:hypothetical protein